MPAENLTSDEAALILRYLENQFPWVTDEDPDQFPDSGADVIDQLGDIYVSLTALCAPVDSTPSVFRDMRHFVEHHQISFRQTNGITGFISRREHVGRRYNARKDGTAVIAKMKITLVPGDDSVVLRNEEFVLRHLAVNGDQAKLRRFLGESRYSELQKLVKEGL